MEVIHNLGVLSIKRNISENAGFLLTNRKGGYCSFFSTPSSRYQGLFYFDTDTLNMYKFIENIEIVGNNNVTKLINGFYFVQREKEAVVESFLMPKDFDALIYELSSANDIDLVLDCKNSYDNREWGRHYEIFEEEGCIIVKFTKKTDRNEDLRHGHVEFILYLAIKADGNWHKNGKWIERNYPYDEGRGSFPFRRHVYNALRLNGTKFVFSMSQNKNDAIQKCNYIFSNINKIKNDEKIYFLDVLKKDSARKTLTNDKINKEIRIAYFSAIISLSKLIVNNKNAYGIFAGLPWFFQFWTRDALISLKALAKIDVEFAEIILYSYLDNIGYDGRLPNLTKKRTSRGLGSADAVGWLFFRCSDLIEKICKKKEILHSLRKSVIRIKSQNIQSAKVRHTIKKYNKIIDKKENECHSLLYAVESHIEKSIYRLLRFHTKDNFELNQAKETWMDTEFNNDSRKGSRIELQVLRLGIYKLMFELSSNQKYKALENILRTNVREKFWSGQMLADGIGDFTIRPNIFISAYVYPELLTGMEWQTCFENALESLWLEWGGLSTIDKENPLFTETNTGENAKSYHRGDSWFWINNLAALTLHKTNKQKFNKYIQKIIDASTEDILWKGCIGCHSELSSAKALESNGCWNQAWSNAMYIEMVEEVFLE